MTAVWASLAMMGFIILVVTLIQVINDPFPYEDDE